MAEVDETDALTLVREWFEAFNRSDAERAARLYAVDCENDQAGDGRYVGREAQRNWLAARFRLLDGAREDGSRRQVTTLGRVERGWTHAEWIGRERRRDTAQMVETAGYEHFLVEEGVIRRQRGVAHPFVAPADPDERRDVGTEPPRRSRRYPSHPIVGVGAVIEQHGRVVLVRRRFEPLAGQWSLPGGTLEVGETLEAGVAREMLEETGLIVTVGPVVEVFDRILLDDQRRVKFHFVLVDYLCRPSGGVLRHGSDVDDAVFVPPSELDKYHLTPKALAIIDRALELAGTRP